jgi:hypothetical protein
MTYFPIHNFSDGYPSSENPHDRIIEIPYRFQHRDFSKAGLLDIFKEFRYLDSAYFEMSASHFSPRATRVIAIGLNSINGPTDPLSRHKQLSLIESAGHCLGELQAPFIRPERLSSDCTTITSASFFREVVICTRCYLSHNLKAGLTVYVSRLVTGREPASREEAIYLHRTIRYSFYRDDQPHLSGPV